MSFKKNIKNILNGITGRKPFKNTVPESKAVNKILVISLYFKGDFLFHTALIEGLRNLYPNAKIDIWVKSRVKDIAEGDQRINNILVFNDVKTSGYNEKSNLNLKGKLSFLKSLRKEKYDIIVDLTGKYSTAVFTLLAKAKYSLGINYNFFGFCYDIFIDLKSYNSKGHLIDKYISVLQKGFNLSDNEYAHLRSQVYTRPYIQINNTDKNHVEEILKNFDIPGDSELIVIHLTSGWSAKELSPEVFAEVVDYFIDKKYFFLFIGDEKDKDRVNILQQLIKNSSVNVNKLYLKLTFMESAELIKRADLLIGSDSAPLHLAGAAGTPSIGIFGPTNPGFSNPVGPIHKIIYHHLYCSASEDMQYCTRNAGFTCATIDCMKMIKAGEIIALAEELLQIKKERKQV